MAAPVTKKPADVNKSAEIRKIATSMKAKGEKPRPSVIVVELKKQGITVAAPQVSNILKKMGFRPLRKRKGAAKGRAAAKATSAKSAAKSGPKKASIVSVDDLIAAKKAAGTIGSTDKAIAALQALKRFEG